MYQAYSNIPDLMEMTEDLFAQAGKLFLKESKENIDYSAPFQRIDIVPFLEKKLEFQFSRYLDSPDDLFRECMAFLRSTDNPVHTEEFFVKCGTNASDLLDRLVSTYIEPLCIQPTFLYGHPTFMCPLAKAESGEHGRPYISDRFELIIKGKELVNAYSELNDPKEQRLRFLEQKQQCANKDGDSTGAITLHQMEEDYCKALEYGLPPTCGWGLGVDRFVMLFTEQSNIKEIIPFPFHR